MTTLPTSDELCESADDVYAVLEQCAGGTWGISGFDDYRAETLVDHCIERGWIVGDVVYVEATDMERPGWYLIDAGHTELTRLEDEADAEPGQAR